MKRALLPGGLGYVGSHTAVVLAEAGLGVVLYDNLSNSTHSVLDCLETITGVRFPLVEADVWGAGQVRREFLYVDDLAEAVVQVMRVSKADLSEIVEPMCSHINVGSGVDVT